MSRTNNKWKYYLEYPFNRQFYLLTLKVFNPNILKEYLCQKYIKDKNTSKDFKNLLNRQLPKLSLN